MLSPSGGHMGKKEYCEDLENAFYLCDLLYLQENNSRK